MDENRTDDIRTDDARTDGVHTDDADTGGLPPGATPTGEDHPAPDRVQQDRPHPDGAGPRTAPRPRTRRLLRIAAGLLALLLLPLLTAETALRLNYTGDPAPGTRTRHQDALWLGHAWVDGRRTDRDVEALARRLRGTGIRDLYVHAGPLEHDGTLPASAYPKARRLIAAVHRELPGVRVQAWLGDKLASESPDGLRLERAATRAAVVTSARQILAAGFEGTHVDLEPLHSGDRDYLSLLDDLRDLTHARGAVLSVAAHQIDPLPAFHSFWGTTTGHPKWWSQAYFGQVARRVDQIAVMSYDTMQPLESLYGGYVAQQTSLALEATPEGTDLLMGLPFYHENRFGHRARAETVPAAVRGVRLGLSRTDAGRARFGVALYVDFAATEADWRAYREDWVATPPTAS
ncbi:membrane protein [Streptomyces hygroscopicus subsp. limoneus]|nr:membrane protein [Streptomyces hygroscopicus subsp. limoneus]